MARQSERLEHEVEEARGELAFSLDELRARMTPREIVDEVVEYARDTPVADFTRNLVRDIRASPLPILVIFAGIAWAAIASALAQRSARTRERMTTRTAEIEARPAETVPVKQTEWEVAPVCEPVE